MKRVAIVQSNYVPWKGYFDLISIVDVLVIYDEVQYTKQDWRNRNLIKSNEKGVEWLSVPVTVNGLYSQRICDTKIADTKWYERHWAKLEACYSDAIFFNEVSEWLKPIYTARRYTYLSELNLTLIDAICSYLKIETKIIDSRDIVGDGGKTGRLVNICEKLDAKEYWSGPAAKNYLELELFERSGIEVVWIDYSGYPEYKQFNDSFNHKVTILDLLFFTGREASSFMKYVK